MGPLGNLKVGGREVETKKDLLCTHKKGTREKRKDESFPKRPKSLFFAEGYLIQLLQKKEGQRKKSVTEARNSLKF